MFETPTVDVSEIRTVLTDAGHTAAGFATLAVKRANDFRLDFATRYEDQLNGFRKQALVVVERVESMRSDVEAAVEPVVARVVDRLPQPAQKVVNQVTETTKDFQARAHGFVVSALTVEETVAKSKATVGKPTTAKAATTTKAAPKRTNAAKPSAKTAPKKTSPKKASVKATAKKATKKVAAKKTAKK
jgi:hypothetical protein